MPVLCKMHRTKNTVLLFYEYITMGHRTMTGIFLYFMSVEYIPIFLFIIHTDFYCISSNGTDSKSP